MKQIRTILAAISLCLFLSVPILAFAASEPEPDTLAGSMENRNVDVDAGEEAGSAAYEKEAEADQEIEAGQETETGQEIEKKLETETVQKTVVEEKKEAEAGHGAEKKQEAGADREAEEKQDTGTGQEVRPRQATEPEKEETIPQADREDFGILRMQNAAAGTGEKLSGAVFAVYKKGGTKIGELTLMEGAASLSLPLGEYYMKQLKAPAGYGVEPARIAFAIAKGETTLVEVTSEIDLTNVNPQDIIPKTGQAPPVQTYTFSILCFMVAILCAVKLWHMDGRSRRKGGARLWQS